MHGKVSLMVAACAILSTGGLDSVGAKGVSVTTTSVCQQTFPSSFGKRVGSGRFVRRPIATAAFNRIDVAGAAELEIAVGSRPSVEVEIDDNLVELMRARAADGVLKLDSEGSFCTTRVPRYKITTPSLARLDLRGSGNARVSGLLGGTLAVVIGGSSDVAATGALNRIDVDVDGSGNVDLTQLRASTVDATINGSGTVKVGPAHTLSAVVNGSGDIHYAGNPTVLNQAVHGNGRIWRH